MDHAQTLRLTRVQDTQLRPVTSSIVERATERRRSSCGEREVLAVSNDTPPAGGVRGDGFRGRHLVAGKLDKEIEVKRKTVA